ncbi:MAG: AAA family ATPase [Elusimicrobia bacterium]|nr:AAA family ATPase [Elusimicrobiota bacterium]
MSAQTVIEALACTSACCAAARRKGAGLVHCPTHDDPRPSLSVTDQRGTLLVHCHGGCAQESVIAELRDRGVWNGTGPKVAAQVVARYSYLDERGDLLYEIERREPKGFRARRPDGQGGWTYSLDGARRVIYRLPEVLAVARAGWRVYVTEGEKDADAITALGLMGTTAPFGAGKWRSEYAAALTGAEVVVVADKDGPGREHARAVARSCSRLARSVRVLELPGEHVKDASDWISAGGTRAQLEALASAAPENASAALRDEVPAERIRRLAFRSAPEFAATTPEAPPWVLNGYIARNAIAEIGGKIKIAGKTTLALAMSRAIVSGDPFAGRQTERTGILYLTEQPAASFREALERGGLLDEERFTVLSWHDAIGVKWSSVVAQAVEECKVREAGVLFVDTLSQWAGIRGDGENSAGEALEALAPLQEAAGRHGLAVVVLRHSRKAGGDVGDDTRGSSAFAGAVDIVLSLRRADGNAEPNIRVLHGLSRFADTPESLALRLTAEEGYVALGTEAALAVEIARRQLLEAAPRTTEHAMTADELIDAAKVRRTSGQEALGALLDLGQLVRTGRGKKGDPYRYHAPEIHSAGTSHTGRQNESGDGERPPEAGSDSRSDSGTGISDDESDDPMLRAAIEVFGRPGVPASAPPL